MGRRRVSRDRLHRCSDGRRNLPTFGAGGSLQCGSCPLRQGRSIETERHSGSSAAYRSATRTVTNDRKKWNTLTLGHCGGRTGRSLLASQPQSREPAPRPIHHRLAGARRQAKLRSHWMTCSSSSSTLSPTRRKPAFSTTLIDAKFDGATSARTSDAPALRATSSNIARAAVAAPCFCAAGATPYPTSTLPCAGAVLKPHPPTILPSLCRRMRKVVLQGCGKPAAAKRSALAATKGGGSAPHSRCSA